MNILPTVNQNTKKSEVVLSLFAEDIKGKIPLKRFKNINRGDEVLIAPTGERAKIEEMCALYGHVYVWLAKDSGYDHSNGMKNIIHQGVYIEDLL